MNIIWALINPSQVLMRLMHVRWVFVARRIDIFFIKNLYPHLKSEGLKDKLLLLTTMVTAYTYILVPEGFRGLKM